MKSHARAGLGATRGCPSLPVGKPTSCTRPSELRKCLLSLCRRGNNKQQKSIDHTCDKMVYPSQRGHFGTLNNLGNTQFSKFTLKDYPSTHRNKHSSKTKPEGSISDLSNKDSWNYLSSFSKSKPAYLSNPKFENRKKPNSKRKKYSVYLTSQSKALGKAAKAPFPKAGKDCSRNKNLIHKNSKLDASKRVKGKKSVDVSKPRSDFSKTSMFRNMSPVINRKILLDLANIAGEFPIEQTIRSQKFIENTPESIEKGYFSVNSGCKSNEFLTHEEPELTPDPNLCSEPVVSKPQGPDLGPLLKDFEDMKLREEDLIHQLQEERNRKYELENTLSSQAAQLHQNEETIQRLLTEVETLKLENKSLTSRLDRYQSRQDLDLTHLETKNRLLTEALNKRNEDVKELESGNEDLIQLLEKCDDKIQKLQEKCNDFD
ncbi:unnamed protein product [Moneuplotes crassus]|uniref:Uncharacterized protein n=1 Tax=Euplotes crassus TaxID=5936 RepID=A0AAD1XA51_EUPCR|nr:unnamed protein product [Moneuplotes crassus]